MVKYIVASKDGTITCDKKRGRPDEAPEQTKVWATLCCVIFVDVATTHNDTRISHWPAPFWQRAVHNSGLACSSNPVGLRFPRYPLYHRSTGELEEAAANVKTSVTAVPHTRTPDISARRSMRSSDPIHAQL